LVHLVFHEGDQRRNHDGQPLKYQCRDLIADGFSTPGGHYDQGILFLQDMSNNLFLERPEGVIAENVFEEDF
jgi:hypothetical protein